VRSVEVLEDLLGRCQWLVDDQFSVADVAIGSYLNYVPLFFPQADLSARPHIAAYMLRCAERPAFGEAFGAQHAGLVQAKAAGWLKSGSEGKGQGPFSGLFGQ
jgi:glutathione S-transferase